jgi:hypothetical protein
LVAITDHARSLFCPEELEPGVVAADAVRVAVDQVDVRKRNHATNALILVLSGDDSQLELGRRVQRLEMPFCCSSVFGK